MSRAAQAAERGTKGASGGLATVCALAACAGLAGCGGGMSLSKVETDPTILTSSVDASYEALKTSQTISDQVTIRNAVSSANLQPAAGRTSAVEVILGPTVVPFEPVCQA